MTEEVSRARRLTLDEIRSSDTGEARKVPPPDFIRLPPPGFRDPHTGMSRSGLNELILPTPRNDYKPPVKSFVIRQRGARTGIRIIDYKSLVDFIRVHEDIVPQVHPSDKVRIEDALNDFIMTTAELISKYLQQSPPLVQRLGDHLQMQLNRVREFQRSNGQNGGTT